MLFHGRPWAWFLGDPKRHLPLLRCGPPKKLCTDSCVLFKVFRGVCTPQATCVNCGTLKRGPNRRNKEPQLLNNRMRWMGTRFRQTRTRCWGGERSPLNLFWTPSCGIYREDWGHLGHANCGWCASRGIL